MLASQDQVKLGIYNAVVTARSSVDQGPSSAP